MNQDSSLPPMLPPSSELGALLFAALPCLTDAYRPIASLAYHMTELTKIKNISSIPSFSGITGIDVLITDKDAMLHSLSFYGKLFRMPLLTTIASLLQGMQFYQAYKDILPGLFSGMSSPGDDRASSFGSMAGLFSGLGGLSPDLLSSLFSGGMSSFFSENKVSDSKETSKQPATAESAAEPSTEPVPSSEPFVAPPPEATATPVSVQDSPLVTSSEAPGGSPQSDDDLYNTLYSFLTPEQQKIYEQLMHTD